MGTFSVNPTCHSLHVGPTKGAAESAACSRPDERVRCGSWGAAIPGSVTGKVGSDVVLSLTPPVPLRLREAWRSDRWSQGCTARLQYLLPQQWWSYLPHERIGVLKFSSDEPRRAGLDMCHHLLGVNRVLGTVMATRRASWGGPRLGP
jgi:hypothetical protein